MLSFNFSAYSKFRLYPLKVLFVKFDKSNLGKPRKVQESSYQSSFNADAFYKCLH